MYRLLTFVCVITLIQACSSAPKPSQQKIESPSPIKPVEEKVLTAEDFIQRAQYASTDLQNLWLLKAAESWQQQEQCDNSIRLVSVLQRQLTVPSEETQAKLILAECYLKQQDIQQVARLLPQLSLQQGFDQRIFTLQAVLLEHEQQWLQAANTVQKLNIQDAEKHRRIWSLLEQASQKELLRARLRYPSIQSWIQLATTSRRFATQPQELKSALNQWQLNNPELAGSTPDILNLAIETPVYTPEKIAVLLPLSGRLNKQAQAIKQGILAAYFQEQERPQLIFIDTAKHAIPQVVTQLQEVDFVVGPLLKDNIEALIQQLPADLPILALNEPEIDNNPQHFFYALAPEDEARQIARHLYQKGHKQPVVIAGSHSASQRMANAFIQLWSETGAQNKPDIITFNDNKTMRNKVEVLLDVGQSKNRIRQIDNSFRKEVHSIARNRRDIDAIVIFAQAGETELLNPIIESSISPFAKLVPVYASSRSYSQDLNKNSIRDLRNLKFIDMPWLLDKQNWKQQQQQSKTLWPQQRDSLQRLYAMGFDTLQLIPQLKHMQLFPQFHSQLTSGALSLKDNQIQRLLNWGKIQQDQVLNLGLD